MSPTPATTSSTTSATPSLSASTNNAAPVSQHHSIAQESLVAVVCVPVGLVVLGFIIFILFGFRGSKARLWLLKRSATPLSDAEFDQWRSPGRDPLLSYSRGTTVYKTAGLRYDRETKLTGPVVRAIRIDSPTKWNEKGGRPITPPDTAQLLPASPTSPTASMKPLMRTVSVPSTAAHQSWKSSMSLQDRPPTPYSATSPPSARDNGEQWIQEAPTSPREPQHRVHLSDVSDCNIDFSYGPESGSPRRESARRESWVHHSRRFSSLSNIVHPNVQGFHMFDLEEGKKMDY